MATAGIPKNFMGNTARRNWFFFEISRSPDSSGHSKVMSEMMRVYFALALLLNTTAASAADDWQPATDRKGQCVAQVPVNWKPGPADAGMAAPNGSSSVLISVSRLATLDDVKKLAGSTYKVDEIFEDSPQRYWISYTADNPSQTGAHWYVATQQPGMICTMEIDFDAQIAQSDAQMIAASLKKK